MRTCTRTHTGTQTVINRDTLRDTAQGHTLREHTRTYVQLYMDTNWVTYTHEEGNTSKAVYKTLLHLIILDSEVTGSSFSI